MYPFLKNKFNPKDSGLIFTLVMLALIAVSLGIGVLMGLSGIGNGISYYIGILVTQAAFFFTALFYCKINRISLFGALQINRPFEKKNLAFSALTGCTMLFALYIPVVAFIKLLELLGYKVSDPSTDILTVTDLLLAVFFVAFLPAVCEEILFRGIILQGLRRFGDAFAVIASAALFMIMHENPQQTLYPLLSGTVMGLVFIKAGNIKYTMVIHFLNNLLSCLWDFIYNILNIQAAPVFWGLNLYDIVFMSVCLLVFIIPLVYFIRKKPEPYSDPQPKILQPLFPVYNPFVLNGNPYNAQGNYAGGYYNPANNSQQQEQYNPFNNGQQQGQYNPFNNGQQQWQYNPFSNGQQQGQGGGLSGTPFDFQPAGQYVEDPVSVLIRQGFIYNPKTGMFYLEGGADSNISYPPAFRDLSKEPRFNPYYTSKWAFLLYASFGIAVCAVFWLVVFFS